MASNQGSSAVCPRSRAYHRRPPARTCRQLRSLQPGAASFSPPLAETAPQAAHQSRPLDAIPPSGTPCPEPQFVVRVACLPRGGRRIRRTGGAGRMAAVPCTYPDDRSVTHVAPVAGTAGDSPLPRRLAPLQEALTMSRGALAAMHRRFRAGSNADAARSSVVADGSNHHAAGSSLAAFRSSRIAAWSTAVAAGSSLVVAGSNIVADVKILVALGSTAGADGSSLVAGGSGLSADGSSLVAASRAIAAASQAIAAASRSLSPVPRGGFVHSRAGGTSSPARISRARTRSVSPRVAPGGASAEAGGLEGPRRPSAQGTARAQCRPGGKERG